MKNMESRLARLESRNRLLTIGLALSTAVLVLLLLTGASSQPSKVIEADSIVFRDAKGRPRMELKREQGERGAEEFGIWFTNTTGDNVGSLRLAEDKVWLSFDQSAQSRKLRDLWALAEYEKINEKTMKPEDKAIWQQEKKRELERIEKTGRLLTDVSVNGVNFLDMQSPKGAFMTKLDEKSLVTRSVAVAPQATVTTTSLRGCITVLDGSATTRAILGAASLTDTKRGDSIQTTPSSLTLFDENGEVIFRAP